jgi:N-acetylglucosaminyldiphosphoundecaprenol N-acetyl-beta-D-mannosaminyltransferase
MTRTTVLGLPVDLLTMEQTLDEVERFIDDGGLHQHVVVNAAKIVEANRSPELAADIAACDLVNADGMSVVWAARILGHPAPERVAGIDLMLRLCERAAERGWPVYLLGARDEVVRKVATELTQRWPTLRIAGSRHGYWSGEEEAGVVADIRGSGAKILFVAIPSPAKEHFLARHKAAMNVPFVMGVGGSFDVIAGRVSRAPEWMQRAGLEWLHRLIQEPRRMFKRYLVGNTRFLILVFRAWRKR